MATAIPDDDELLDLLQPIVAGIGGYSDMSLVRPGWQSPDLPNDPDFKIDWCGFRIARTYGDTFPFEQHVPEGEGYDVFEYSEVIELLISTFGPNSQKFARTLKDGFRVAQNRQALQQLSMDTLFISDPVTIPALLMNVWRRRVDITVSMRRYVTQEYRVPTVLALPTKMNNSGPLGINNERYVEPLTEPPAP